MVKNETMYWLAASYQLGIGIATGVIVLMYVGISLAMFFHARKKGVNVSVCAMIPVWHLKYAFAGMDFKPKKPISFKKKSGEVEGNLE